MVDINAMTTYMMYTGHEPHLTPNEDVLPPFFFIGVASLTELDNLDCDCFFCDAITRRNHCAVGTPA